jgi:glucosamine--fructose-6-phosphate aminotransferase (isomerizing)
MKPSEGDLGMLAEIENQPEAWARSIELVEAMAGRLRQLARGREEVLFTGCGSGLNAAEAIAPVFQRFTGLRACAVPAAELVFFAETVLVPGSRALVVPISRSGATTETLQAGEEARRRDLPTLALTCRPESPLARRSTEAIVLEAAGEQSVTTTQSLTSMVLTGQLLSGIVSGNAEYLAQLRRLPALAEARMERFHKLGRRLGEEKAIRKFAFVASGSLRGLAKEAQLKIKEMVLLPADSYPLLDYRHGPKSNVDAGMLVAVLGTDRTHGVEAEFLAEMKGLRGRLLYIGEKAEAGIAASADFVAELESGLPDFARDVLYLIPLHFLAYYKSLAEGQSPSTPKNLTYWVRTAGLAGSPGTDGAADKG